jgi:hypothetical protein
VNAVVEFQGGGTRRFEMKKQHISLLQLLE